MINNPFSRAAKIFASAIVLVSAASADAAVLDWDTNTWNSSATTALTGAAATGFQTYTVGGVQITVRVERGSNTAGSEISSLVVNNTQFTGRASGSALALSVDYDGGGGNAGNTSRTTDYVRVTISFSYAVSNLSFQLWDIDYGNETNTPSQYQDVIRNFRTNGSFAAPAGISFVNGSPDAQTFTDGSFGGGPAGRTALRGISTNGQTNITGSEDDGGTTGDVQLNYSGTISSVSFEYWAGNGAGNGGSGAATFTSNAIEPTLQRIGLSDISFTVIPEVFTGRGALLVCGIAMVSPLFGRRRRLAV